MADRRSTVAVLLAGLTLTAAGCIALARMELNSLHDAFETDARIIHRLLSQRTAQQDAVMAMLALLQPATENSNSAPGPRITAVYPQILEIRQRIEHARWDDAALDAGEKESRNSKRAAVGGVDFSAGRYRMVQAASPASYAVQIDIRGMVPWEEWPMSPTPVRYASPLNTAASIMSCSRAVTPKGYGVLSFTNASPPTASLLMSSPPAVPAGMICPG